MVVFPSEIPVTTPVLAFTVPIALLLLLHVPPETLFDRVVLLDAQTVVVPVIAAG
jgi:hypothetical protein